MNKKEEIFTIGDKTTLGIITNFRLLDNEIMVDFNNKNSTLLKSKQLQHFKQPLFKTEDGVDIFENDLYYYYNHDDIECILAYNDISEDKNNRRLWNKYKCFSTKEVAEEYILMNKPCLSVNDVLNSSKGISDALFNKIKELVKSKLCKN